MSATVEQAKDLARTAAEEAWGLTEQAAERAKVRAVDTAERAAETAAARAKQSAGRARRSAAEGLSAVASKLDPAPPTRARHRGRWLLLVTCGGAVVAWIVMRRRSPDIHGESTYYEEVAVTPGGSQGAGDAPAAGTAAGPSTNGGRSPAPSTTG
jgi:hypothetical protein